LGLLAVVLATVMALGPGAAPVRATFPGANGKLAAYFVSPSSGITSVMRLALVGADGQLTDRFGGSPLHEVDSAKFSPDGRRVAVTLRVGMPQVSQVCVARTNGDRLNCLAAGFAPAWSPDGRRLVYLFADSAPYAIYSVPATGGSPYALASNAASGQIEVSVTGQIAFTGLNGKIWAVKVDGTGLRQVTTGPGVDSSPSWAPDGHRLTYEQAERYRAFIVKLGGSTTSIPGGGRHPVWSPDGKLIVYEGEGAGLRLVRPDGTGGHRLPVSPAHPVFPHDPTFEAESVFPADWQAVQTKR
jgi:TolB protein